MNILYSDRFWSALLHWTYCTVTGCGVHCWSEYTVQWQAVECTAGMNILYSDRLWSALLEWTYCTVTGCGVHCWSEHTVQWQGVEWTAGVNILYSDRLWSALLEWTYCTVRGCGVHCWSKLTVHDDCYIRSTVVLVRCVEITLEFNSWYSTRMIPLFWYAESELQLQGANTHHTRTWRQARSRRHAHTHIL